VAPLEKYVGLHLINRLTEARKKEIVTGASPERYTALEGEQERQILARLGGKVVGSGGMGGAAYQAGD
jgi:hypothetical protein